MLLTWSMGTMLGGIYYHHQISLYIESIIMVLVGLVGGLAGLWYYLLRMPGVLKVYVARLPRWSSGPYH